MRPAGGGTASACSDVGPVEDIVDTSLIYSAALPTIVAVVRMTAIDEDGDDE